MHAVLVAAAAAAVSLALAPGPLLPPASPAVEVVQGEVLRLESVQDATAMAAMSVGVPVTWDVGVSASEPDGTIAVGLRVATTDDAFRAVVRSCTLAWSGSSCTGAVETLYDSALDSGEVALATQRAADVRWYRIDVELVDDVPGARVDLVLVASGSGETIASDGGTLPRTGLASSGWLVATAAGAVAVGALALGASRSRRRSP